MKAVLILGCCAASVALASSEFSDSKLIPIKIPGNDMLDRTNSFQSLLESVGELSDDDYSSETSGTESVFVVEHDNDNCAGLDYDEFGIGIGIGIGLVPPKVENEALIFSPDCTMKTVHRITEARRRIYESNGPFSYCDAFIHSIINGGGGESLLLGMVDAERANCVGWAGFAPIFYAIEAGNWPLTRRLLEQGAKTDALHPVFGCRPLYTFCERDWSFDKGSIEHEIFKSLLGEGCSNIGKPGDFNYIPASFALAGREDVLKALVDEGCPVLLSSNLDWSSLVEQVPFPENPLGRSMKERLASMLGN